MSALPNRITPAPLSASNEAQIPRSVVTLDGSRYIPVSYETEINAHGSTDTATITLPLANGPDWTNVLFRGDVAQNSDKPVYCEIFAGFPSNPNATPEALIPQLLRRFYGIVDQYSIVLHGDFVTFSCRSLAAPLVSNKITTIFNPAQTTVDFVRAMATRFGLQVNTLLANAPLKMVQIMGDEFKSGIHNVGIWDLMQQMAVWDDVDVWVDPQGVLWYAAPDLITRTNVDLVYGRDLTECAITHSPQFSKNVEVQVRTYSKRVKRSTTTRVRPDGNGGSTSSTTSRPVTSSPVFGTTQSVSTTTSSSGVTSTTVSNTTGGVVSTGFTRPGSDSGKQKYIKYVRNVTPAAALALAQSIWKQISQHEYAVALRLPVTKANFAKLGITSFVNLHATPYGLANGKYWPRRITEVFDPEGSGFDWTIDALNHQIAQGGV